MCRPFHSTEDHDETIIRNHNSVVEPDDVVLCVGLADGQERWKWEREVPGRISHPGSRVVPTATAAPYGDLDPVDVAAMTMLQARPSSNPEKTHIFGNC